MKILLARYSGFCFGVRNAIRKIVDEINASDEEILIYGPLIHNPQTMALLEHRGVKTIKSLENIDRRIVAIRTHGIPSDETAAIRSRSARMINLTCPRVARIQSIIKKHAGQGFYTIIVGDREHAEVESLKSFAGEGCLVLPSADDIPELPPDHQYLVVSQTTFERQVFNDITARLQALLPRVIIIDTICESTGNRQDEIQRRIDDGIDTLVVVGGTNSANTRRLAEIGRERNVHTILIETAEELHAGDFARSSVILVAAGASTPGWITNQVLNSVYAFATGRQPFLIRTVKGFFEQLFRANVFPAIGALYITLTGFRVIGAHPPILPALVSFFYIFTMYFLNAYLDRESLRYNNPAKYRSLEGRARLFIFIIILLAVISGAIISMMNTISIFIIASSYVVGCLYSFSAVRRAVYRTPLRVVQRLYNSRFTNVAGWLPVVVLAPLLDAGASWPLIAAQGFFATILVFLRTILGDLMAYQADFITGRESILIWIGKIKTGWVVTASAAVSIAMMAGIAIAGGSPMFMVYALPIAYCTILWHLMTRDTFLVPIVIEQLIDACFILLAIAYHFITIF